jgi:hypothetical protein
LPAHPRSPAHGGARAFAAPKISKFLQAFSKPFQGNSKEIPWISKLFQTFSLAVSSDINGLQAESPDSRFFLFAPPVCRSVRERAAAF